MNVNRDSIENTLKSLGYTFFEDTKQKCYDLNIVGVRNSATTNIVTNLFDDFITVTYKDEKGEWKFHQWDATTDPGKKGVLKYGNKKGVARMVPGQYRGMLYIGKHQGKYTALCQKKPCAVWRDDDKDLEFDELVAKIDTGIFGINMHKAGMDSTFVENWSEGCQVFKREKDFNEFMKICEKARLIHGNSFTYTLLTSNQLVN